MALPAPYRRARRRHPRVNVGPVPCRFRLLFVNGRPVDVRDGVGTAVNISRGGLCLCSQLRLPTQTPVILTVQFTLEGRTFELGARLVWRRVSREDYAYGLSFWGSGEACREAFNRFLDDLRLDRFA